MAVDSSLFVADIPAGTYAVGDVIPFVLNVGPANVRSGRGAAVLKQIATYYSVTGISASFRVHVKNSDWVDDVCSFPGRLAGTTAMDDHSGAIQFGCDNQLTPNSGWQIWAECVNAATTTTAQTLFALIDIDYPSVSAINDPDSIIGIPTTITYDVPNVPVQAVGSLSNASWTIKNVDYFKAGYQYCIQAVEAYTSTSISGGFMAFSSAAGMGGLQRIIPFNVDVNSIRYKLRYASKLSKGPMDVKLLLFNATATTCNMFMCHDYVKRQGA